MNIRDRLVISPCCNPDMQLEPALAAYSELGFTKFEAFTGWAKSSLNWQGDPNTTRAVSEQYGMKIVSMHLPPLKDREGIAHSVKAAEFAKAIGASIVLFKATTRGAYVESAKEFLDRTEHLGITPVLQNHSGSAISTLADFEEVIGGIHDARMKALLEVGHFHSQGVSWQQGHELLGESIALVHVKDQIGKQSVPYGTGEIDLAGLFTHMDKVGYRGDYVVEMEVKDKENTLKYLAEALAYIEEADRRQHTTDRTAKK